MAFDSTEKKKVTVEAWRLWVKLSKLGMNDEAEALKVVLDKYFDTLSNEELYWVVYYSRFRTERPEKENGGKENEN